MWVLGHLPSLVFSELPRSVVWFGIWHWFGGSSQSWLLQIFLLFFSLFLHLVFHTLCKCSPFKVVAQFSGILFFSPPLVFFFSLIFNVESFYWHSLNLRDFSSAMSSLLIKPSRACLSLCIWPVAFKTFLLRLSISLLMLPICSYMLSTLFISTLSILITVVLNSWPENSNISCHTWVWFCLFRP